MKWLHQWYNLLLSPQRKFARQVRQLIGQQPVDLTLYKTAFTHSSASPEVGFNNERLELIGDAVFDVVVSEYLYYKYPFKSEGFLTEMRAKVVSRKTANELAQKMGLQDLVETTMNDKHLLNSSTLGNAFEALVGAIYFDLGFARTKHFIEQRVIRIHFDLDELETRTINFKSKLIQYGQKNSIEIAYRMLQEEKTKQGKRYTMGVFLDDQLMAKATAFNKKQAEQAASKELCEQLDLANDA